jgi:hypothetical protein
MPLIKAAEPIIANMSKYIFLAKKWSQLLIGFYFVFCGAHFALWRGARIFYRIPPRLCEEFYLRARCENLHKAHSHSPQ